MCKNKLTGLFLIIALVIWLTDSIPAQNLSSGLKTKNKYPANKLSATEEIWYLNTEDQASFLYIREIGRGEPVIVLHGGPGIAHNYMTDIANGLENQFHFIFYDQRGSGLSYTYTKEAISMEKNIEDLEKLRKALGLEKMNLISHSAGTYLAMSYLEKYPQNVKNMVLLGATDPKNGSRKFFTDEELEGFSKQAGEAKAFQERAEVKSEIEKAGLNKPNLSPKQDFLLRRIKSAAGTIYHIEKWTKFQFFYVNQNAAQGARVGMNLVYDWSIILTLHPFPITVINGEYDYQIGRKGSPMWKRVVSTEAKNVKLVLIDKAGHNSWIDDPVIFRKALQNALAREK